jgi:outer membrane receptor protein involved in Fe transport
VDFTIENQAHQPLSGAVLYLDQQAYTANASGRIHLEVKEEKIYQVVVFVEGYQTAQQPLTLLNGSTHTIQLTKDTTLLDAIEITRQSEEGEVNRGIIRAVEVDAKSHVVRPASLSDLMNRTTGVRVRQSGELGGETNVNLNGFQGTAIRYFKDGIPLNYLGNGYNLSNIPLDLISKVEVYKGVIPVYLASDALGGAINLVSNVNQSNALRASVEYGSFNTVRTALRGHYNLNDHVFIGGEFFSNYADNDYKIHTPDPELATTKAKVRLFHNRYRHYYTNMYVGVANVKAADLLQLDLSYYTLNKQVQHSPTTMLTPYGGMEDRQHSLIPTLR